MGREVALPPFGIAKRGDPPEGGESRRLQARISAEVDATVPCAASPLGVAPMVIATAATITPTKVETYAGGILRSRSRLREMSITYAASQPGARSAN
jgi:hypothetical protein